MNIHAETVLKALQAKRPIFHSEADFQHALAWEIHQRHPNASVRLEVNRGIGTQREYLDLVVSDAEIRLAIELKYKTKKLDTVFSGEEFHLQNHGAQDVGRYDFIKDIARQAAPVHHRRIAVAAEIF
jgi:hypothetical protein